MKKLHNNQSGFGLIEVIIGITMLLITSTAALSLSHTVTTAERLNEKRVVAYNLAQQVIEEIRRKRDSNWDDLKAETRWEDSDILDDLNNYYATTGSECEVQSTSEIVCDIDNTEYTVTKNIDELTDDNISGLHDIANDDRGSYISGTLAKRVEVVVEWFDKGEPQDLSLVTMLSDWSSISYQ
ncbi:MAG: type II secretion system protein [Patescibacteria group bacterium]